MDRGWGEWTDCNKKENHQSRLCNFGLTILFCQACAEPINSICEEELSKFESSRLALMQGRRKHEALVERFVVGFILKHK